MKRKIGLLIFGLFSSVGVLSFVGANFDPMQMPKFAHYVNDYSQVLTEEQFQELNQLAKKHGDEVRSSSRNCSFSS